MDIETRIQQQKEINKIDKITNKLIKQRRFIGTPFKLSVCTFIMWTIKRNKNGLSLQDMYHILESPDIFNRSLETMEKVELVNLCDSLVEQGILWKKEVINGNEHDFIYLWGLDW